MNILCKIFGHKFSQTIGGERCYHHECLRECGAKAPEGLWFKELRRRGLGDEYIKETYGELARGSEVHR